MFPQCRLLILLPFLLVSTGCSDRLPPAKNPPQLACMVKKQPNYQIIQVNRHIRVILSSDAVFEGRTSEIKQSAHKDLNTVAHFLLKYPCQRMTVTGYTDDLGTYSADADLSHAQAQNVITYFWTRGITEQCLQPIGMGKDSEKTIASNRTVHGKTTNRRIEIRFMRSN